LVQRTLPDTASNKEIRQCAYSPFLLREYRFTYHVTREKSIITSRFAYDSIFAV
jgi:hypothetical protein